MHVETNFPLKKQESSWDIGLRDYIDDFEYLNILQEALPKLPSTDLVIYQAGVDVMKFDRLGKAGLTLEGVRKRDELVFEYCKSKQLPVVVTMGGGYQNDKKNYTAEHVAEVHHQTVKTLAKVYGVKE